MPNTKNYSTRLRVLDQCLRSGHAYSGKELTEFINRELELRGEPTITSRTTLFNAIRKKTTVELRYQSFRMADPQTLIVHPYYLKQYNNRWFLFCCNGDHTNLSNYPLDRILSVKLAHVPYRETDIDFDEYFADVIGVTKREGQEAEKVLLRFPKNEYPYVATKPWHGSQKKVDEDERSVTIALDVVINYELEQKILSWGDYVEVLQPQTLRDTIGHRLENAIRNNRLK